MKKYALLSLFSMIAILFMACKKDKIDQEHDHEAIASVELHITKEGSDVTLVSKWLDEDGDGGKDPVADEIALDATSRYTFSIQLKDHHGHLLTEEIIEHESHAHRFYYIPSKASMLTFSGLDKDANGITLGSAGTFETGTHSHGKLRIVLRHYGTAQKSETDLVDHAAASTDMDISFDMHIH